MQNASSYPETGILPDEHLVDASLRGDREAFGTLVARYQRLLCSLAYSATGSLSESEDLAQETFVEAWRQLPTLREPAKLRPWLCSILRHKIGRLRRAQHREPVRLAEGLDQAEDLPSSDLPTESHAIANEEQALMWRALERVPELYREPLVLYYRENRSIEHVAVALDLTEDTVKQRLSRGRKLLQDHVLGLVEGALSRSTPGRLFTVGVLAVLPDLTAPVTVTGVGAATAKGGMLAKTTGIAPLVAGLSGAISAALTLRANLDQARTPTERRAVVKITAVFFFGALAWLFLVGLLRWAAVRWPESSLPLAALSQAIILGFIAGFPLLLQRTMQRMRQLRSAERSRHPELFQDPRDQVGSVAGEFRSRWTLLGIPLVHLRFAAPDAGQPPVMAWIAGGDRAYGLLMAWGGIAVAPISLGAVSFGLITLGTVSFGLYAVGTASVGLIAIGCMAVGVHARGWLSALGWDTAQSGGFSLAQWAAEGPVAFAAHANDPRAREIFTSLGSESSHSAFLLVISLLTIIPITLYARAVRRRMGRQA